MRECNGNGVIEGSSEICNGCPKCDYVAATAEKVTPMGMGISKIPEIDIDERVKRARKKKTEPPKAQSEGTIDVYGTTYKIAERNLWFEVRLGPHGVPREGDLLEHDERLWKVQRIEWHPKDGVLMPVLYTKEAV